MLNSNEIDIICVNESRINEKEFKIQNKNYRIFFENNK